MAASGWYLMGDRRRQRRQGRQPRDAGQLSLGILQGLLGQRALGHIHHRTDILRLAGVGGARAAEAFQPPDRAIGQNDAEAESKIGSLRNCLRQSSVEGGPVLRVDPTDRLLVGGLALRGIEAEDPEVLFGPAQLSGRGVPGPAAGSRQPLSFGELRLALSQPSIRADAVSDFRLQLLVGRRKRARPVADALLQLLVQAPDFLLGLSQLGGLDDVPDPAAPRQRDLVRAGDLEHVGSAARRQRIGA
jgi:hypothetical protein